MNKNTPNYRGLTLGMEYVACAIRALADGHSSDSQAVSEPVEWAISVLREMTADERVS